MRLPIAAAAQSCPVTLRIGEPYAVSPDSTPQGTVQNIIASEVSSFTQVYFPGTTVQLSFYYDTASALWALANHNVDVVLTDRYLRPDGGESVFYSWQVNRSRWQNGVYQRDVWVAVNNKGSVGRIDNSSQVRADDFANFLRSQPGINAMQFVGYDPPPPVIPPIADPDVNLGLIG